MGLTVWVRPSELSPSRSRSCSLRAHQLLEVLMLTSLRFVARALLGLAFIVLGWDAAQEPGKRVELVAALGVPQPDLAVRVNGYTMVVAGIALALGILPRLSAAALIASLIPTTAAGHSYWKE